MTEKHPTEHIGDGVYAIFDGHGIWLHANDHQFPTDKVYLEPSVLIALITFAKLHLLLGKGGRIK